VRVGLSFITIAGYNLTDTVSLGRKRHCRKVKTTLQVSPERCLIHVCRWLAFRLCALCLQCVKLLQEVSSYYTNAAIKRCINWPIIWKWIDLTTNMSTCCILETTLWWNSDCKNMILLRKKFRPLIDWCIENVRRTWNISSG